MAKIQRVTGKVFGGTATATGADPQIGQFGSALAGTYLGTTDISTIQQLPAWGQGFIGAVTTESQFPALPEVTGFGKVLSQQQCYILQQGVAEWDSGTTYYTGSFCSKGGLLYVSTIDENLNNDPESDLLNWNLYPVGKADVDFSNVNSTGTSLASGWGMPSNNYINLTLGASGASYTAPANGWFTIRKNASANGQYMYMVTDGGVSMSVPYGLSGGESQCYVPVRKGGYMQLIYNLGGTTSIFQFRYAQGEEV